MAFRLHRGCMEQQTSYQVNWDRLRRLYRLEWIYFLLYFPGVAIVGFSLARLFHSQVPFMLTWVAYVIGSIILGNRLMAFRCPRCGKPFFQARWFHNSFTRRCVHCNLPKWSIEQ